MPSLAHELHLLVRALDRSAELRLAPFGISYARFLALVVVRDHEGLTQRDLAGALGQSEPTASRTATALAEAGWVEVGHARGTGNRRALSLTPAGHELVDAAGAQLGDAFDEAVRGLGLDPSALAWDVRRLTTLLEESP